jgi:hypothetical protein
MKYQSYSDLVITYGVMGYGVWFKKTKIPEREDFPS